MSNRADNFLDVVDRFEQGFSVQNEPDRNENLDGVQEPEFDYKLFATALNDLELEEDVTVTPIGFSNDVYYVSVNEETFGFNCSKDIARQFEKMVVFNPGSKCLNWLKKNSSI
jgi:hypothetical protein